MKTTNQNQNFVYQVIEEQPRRTDHQVNQPAVVNTKVPMGYVPDEAPGDVIIDQIAETPETPATANATDPFPLTVQWPDFLLSRQLSTHPTIIS